jgi:hypothetical protein
MCHTSRCSLPLPRERRTGEPDRANDQQRVTLLPRQVLSNASHLVDREKELQDRVLCVGWWGVSVRMPCWVCVCVLCSVMLAPPTVNSCKTRLVTCMRVELNVTAVPFESFCHRCNSPPTHSPTTSSPSLHACVQAHKGHAHACVFLCDALTTSTVRQGCMHAAGHKRHH